MRTVSYVHSGAFSSRPAEELARMLASSSGMSRVLLNSGGSEAIESAIKLARQYHVERGEPQRVHFIARDQSYHGNTLGALSLNRHVSRRKHYLPLLNRTNFHAVSPCYAYRYKLEGETDEGYVQRLRDELESKFEELGPGNVAAFFAETSTSLHPAVGPVSSWQMPKGKQGVVARVPRLEARSASYLVANGQSSAPRQAAHQPCQATLPL